MSDTLLDRLQALLKHKKSKAYYAEKLGISESEVESLMSELKTQYIQTSNFVSTDAENTTATSNGYEFSIYYHPEDGTLKSEVVSDFEPKSIEELVALHRVDTTKYKVVNYWTKQRGEKFFSSLFCSLIKEQSIDRFTENFTEFLKSYVPTRALMKTYTNSLTKASLILPKQDAHFNKYDINGENSVEERFKTIESRMAEMIQKAILSYNLNKITYIVGSDQFNSEWTSLTTKGTPQQNILSYQDAFKQICDHEVRIIDSLLSFADEVEVIFVPGNHDEYVGWHLVSWLETYFRSSDNVSFDTSPKNRKYVRYGSSGIMFNHGDALKANDLAHKFPIEFKDDWSACDNYYIFTGDKHHEMSMDIHGIKFYQVPQLSKARSNWDDKNGHTCSKAEMTGFVITEFDGMTDIYKSII
jgi:hypothetical protein